ncbi:MAG: hypothetical protein LBD53_10940 [Tannerella sp.]|jgi:hypothetical protein|nr:hypothetical protein [Tannerella sp.]
MKKSVFYIICLFLFAASVSTIKAQSPAQTPTQTPVQTPLQPQDKQHQRGERKPFDREAFFAKRNCYIAEKMGLTTEETAVFFPMENELIQKKFEAGRECFRLEREMRKKENKTEKDYQILLKCREDSKSKRDTLDRKYLEKFKKILTAEQILKYQNADREFYDREVNDKTP